MNIYGCEDETFNGCNGLFGYDQEIVEEVESMRFSNKEEISNGEDNYIKDNTREDKDENLNIFK